MAWPVLTPSGSCAYHQCSYGQGHSVCDTIANYLEELFQAVESTIQDPRPENIERLRELYERGK